VRKPFTTNETRRLSRKGKTKTFLTQKITKDAKKELFFTEGNEGNEGSVAKHLRRQFIGLSLRCLRLLLFKIRLCVVCDLLCKF
jgi:hypothetical protein